MQTDIHVSDRTKSNANTTPSILNSPHNGCTVKMHGVPAMLIPLASEPSGTMQHTGLAAVAGIQVDACRINDESVQPWIPAEFAKFQVSKETETLMGRGRTLAVASGLSTTCHEISEATLPEEEN
jgi:hypothetical protein